MTVNELIRHLKKLPNKSQRVFFTHKDGNEQYIDEVHYIKSDWLIPDGEEEPVDIITLIGEN